MCEAVHARGGLVKLHICGNTGALLPDMVRCGADLFNVDHLVNSSSQSDVRSAVSGSAWLAGRKSQTENVGRTTSKGHIDFLRSLL